MDRATFLSETINRDMFGLEIGPSFAPSFPKRDGWQVETVDHASADELRLKYAGRNDVDRIENVDYILDERPLHEIIGQDHKYDFIFSSHVIEHIIDPIGFFRSCDRLLKPSGSLVLVVPDKRHCFDFLQPLTSLGDLINAFDKGERKHSNGNVLDFYLYTADFGGHAIWESHWGKDLGLAPHFSKEIIDAYQVYEAAKSGPEYHDIHAWNFVPSSFRLIMNDLQRCGLIGLKEVSFYSTPRCEFYFTASSSGSGAPVTRLEIYRDMAREQIDGLNQILGAEARH